MKPAPHNLAKRCSAVVCAGEVYSPLTATEITILADCEQIIERGQRSFIDVGNALATIRESRLYRATHDTFETYCKQRWKIGRNYANKQIAAAKIVQSLGTTVPILPTTETQVRPLLEFDEADQPKVWEKVVKQITSGNGDSQTITTRQITDVIEHEIRKSDDEPFQKVNAQREVKARRYQANHAQHKVEESKARKKREAEEAAAKAKLRATIEALPADKNNAVAYIRELLGDGGLHPRDQVSSHASFWTTVRLTAIYVNELKSPSERSKRLEKILSWGSLDHMGHGIIDTTLAAMVWLGLVKQDGDGEHTAYRLTEHAALNAEEATR